MLTRIRIKNFRSLKSVDISCEKLTTFVGENDAGKSNILRALNLFFNGETDFGEEFDFYSDFSTYHATGTHKAKEVSVELTFRLPKTYRQKLDPSIFVVWKKTWRESHWFEKRYFADRRHTPIPSTRKINALLNKIIFRLIPAIKGSDYFYEIFGQLYDVISSVSQGSLKRSAKEFEEQIAVQLGSLPDDIGRILHGDAAFYLPTDLRPVFEDLELRINDVPVSRKGDGVKVRQIPLLLDFFATQGDKISRQGTTSTHYIWGYEEPENNLELGAAFRMAEQFEQLLAPDRRVLLMTTHSPVFYNFSFKGLKEKKSALYRVSGGSGPSKLQRVDAQTTKEQLDSDMGLMELLAPHIEKQREILSQYQESEKEWRTTIASFTKPLILMEGKTDPVYLKKALNLFGKEGLLDLCDIDYVGGVNKNQQDICSGKDNLTRFYKFLMVNKNLSQRPVLLIYDSDAKRQSSLDPSDRVDIYCLPVKKDSKIQAGIENLLSLDNYPDKYQDCIDRSNPQTDSYGLPRERSLLNKNRFCQRVCKEGTKETFQSFSEVVEDIEKWLDRVTRPAS